ncbi:MAG: succinate dehydrogenase cytochrome b subunit, partial [Bacteroidota bacterium]
YKTYNMNWLSKFLTSSIGRKLIMSLTGIFLILFLIVHLIGNLQLLVDDGGETFNLYAYMMTHNPFIKTVSWGLYFFILLHTVQGLLLARKNRSAKGSRYAVNSNKTSWASKNMALLGILIFAFMCMHMGDFWYKMKFTDQLSTFDVDGYSDPVKDLYTQVKTSFGVWWVVLIYLIGVLALAVHLKHGFQSAFQTLGLNHKKYTPLIQRLGSFYSFVVPFGFVIIPIIYFGDAQGWWSWFS